MVFSLRVPIDTSHLTLLIANGISLTLVGIILFCIWKQLWSLLLAMTLLGAFVEVIKPLFGNQGIFARPEGATACGLFCIPESMSVAGTPGFPSGHVTVATFFAITMYFMYAMHVGRNKSSDVSQITDIIDISKQNESTYAPNIYNMIAMGSVIVYIILMGYSRWRKRCHNIPQILTGIVLGTVAAIGYRAMYLQ